MRRLWCCAASALILLLGMVTLAPATVAHMAPATTPPLLPGESLWNGLPSFDFGANDGVNWDPQYNMDVAPEGAVIQRDLKNAGVPIARTWFFQNSLVDNHAMSDAEQLQKLQAVQNSGMVCFANFPTENTVAYDLHLLAILGGACPYVEVMNEPDIETAPWNNNQQIDPTAYLNFWNSFVSQARASYPGILFGGPAEYDNQGDYCTYNNDGTSECFLQKVMLGMRASGNLPDFVTYHWYPCWNDSASSCLGKASTFASAAQQVIGWADGIFGKPMPVICSEWNADPGNPSYMTDRSWDAQYVTAATQNIETSGLSGAMEFDISSYGNYSADDLFDIYSGGQPFQTFTAYAAELARVRGGGPVTTPTPLPTSPATATVAPPTPTPGTHATATPGPSGTATTTPAPGQTPQSTPLTRGPTATPPPTGPLSLVQSLSTFAAEVVAPRASFTQPVHTQDGLVATVALLSDSATKSARIASLTDTLGNSWTRLATGTTSGPEGSMMEADIWFAPSKSAGADTVTVTLSSGVGVRAILTIAEVRGPVIPEGGTAAASSGKRFQAAVPNATSSDLLVGVFVAAGADPGTAIADGKAQLGAVCLPSTGLQSDQSYGRGTSALYTTVSNSTGEVAVAALGS